LGLPGEEEVRQVPLPLEDRPGHSPQLQPLHLYLIIVIILQEPLFLRETVKYIQ